jgi:hypothetical protein
VRRGWTDDDPLSEDPLSEDRGSSLAHQRGSAVSSSAGRLMRGGGIGEQRWGLGRSGRGAKQGQLQVGFQDLRESEAQSEGCRQARPSALGLLCL